jgi:hypothetical protein
MIPLLIISLVQTTIWSAFITVLKDVQLQIHGFIFKENSVYPYIISLLASNAEVAPVKKIVFYTPFGTNKR